MKLKHNNIIAYHDFGEIAGHPFVVMDLADESLASKLKSGPLSLRESLHVVACCVSGLEYLHGQACIHRDVKPANILRFGERFVLGDLGIVQWSGMNEAFTSAGTITRASVQLGSWYYMAPEQRRAPHEVNTLSDVYALGISWYEMLTGRTLDPAEVAAQAFANPIEDSTASDMIRKMIRFSPEDRPRANELAPFLADVRAKLD